MDEIYLHFAFVDYDIIPKTKLWRPSKIVY